MVSILCYSKIWLVFLSLNSRLLLCPYIDSVITDRCDLFYSILLFLSHRECVESRQGENHAGWHKCAFLRSTHSPHINIFDKSEQPKEFLKFNDKWRIPKKRQRPDNVHLPYFLLQWPFHQEGKKYIFQALLETSLHITSYTIYWSSFNFQKHSRQITYPPCGVSLVVIPFSVISCAGNIIF